MHTSKLSMKTKAICSFFVLFAIVAVMVSSTPAAFADHSEVTIGTAEESGFSQDCAPDNCYIPGTATVDVGGKVIMTNTDTTGVHTFTSGIVDGFTPMPDAVFDSGVLMSGDSFEWSPDTVGEQPYYCLLHTWMVGTIIVQEVEAEEEVHEEEHEEETMEKESHEEETMMNMEDDASATGMLSDGTMVSIWTSTPTAGEVMEISIEFADSEHVNHDMMVTQNGEEVMMDEGAHHHEGKGVHTTAPLSSSDPVDITVTFQGYGVNDPKTGPIGEEVVFSNVVPEFGTIAMMILAVAIISIIAVTAKSRVVPRF